AAAALGGYDFRVVFVNLTTNATLSRVESGLVSVANNPPLADGLAGDIPVSSPAARLGFSLCHTTDPMDPALRRGRSIAASWLCGF
ncbi:MAG: hypothetical protein ACE5FJ_06980, partial [Gemmatimonadales bacterium]